MCLVCFAEQVQTQAKAVERSEIAAAMVRAERVAAERAAAEMVAEAAGNAAAGRSALLLERAVAAMGRPPVERRPVRQPTAGGRRCHRCGEPGNFARECPAPGVAPPPETAEMDDIIDRYRHETPVGGRYSPKR